MRKTISMSGIFNTIIIAKIVRMIISGKHSAFCHCD